jgi:Holliday junction resolvasome RuvABC endonuclease subunit
MTLSVYPNRRGFGYVVIEGPRLLVDYGICTVKPISNDAVMTRLKKIINFYKPTKVLLREADRASVSHSPRVGKLIGAIGKFVKDKDIPVYRYSREQIKNVFEQFGATTKYEIAQKIIGEYDELKDRAPKPRKAWMEEDYNMGIFDAMAIIGTHNYLKE